MGILSGIQNHVIMRRTKRINLNYLAATAILCSLSYLAATWHHTTTASAATLLVTSTCHPPPPPPNTTLDFSPHHTAEDSLLHALATSARGSRFPPCNLSEYTPCHDTKRSLKFPRNKLIYRERHCPEAGEEVMRCRVVGPEGYREAVRWPESRDSVWYANVPHKHLTVEKKGQNWVRLEGERFTFPGGGTMFPHGAKAYIDEIGRLINLRDGSIRTAVDTGCGVASFGAYLLSQNVLTMSFAPKDTHVAQVQFALERGVPALIDVLASIRLPYPSRAFDMAHCSRCLIPWGQYDGLYLIEVDRILRPGGYWILSGPPINWETHSKGWERTVDDLKSEQNGIESVAKSLCWKKLVQKGDIAIWQKPKNHIHCKLNRKVFKKPQFCHDQDADKAWYTKLDTCLTPLPEASDVREIAGGSLEKWPKRLNTVPPRIISGSLEGFDSDNFTSDNMLWKKRLSYYKALDHQLREKGRYRNLLDMNSHLGGFAAALVDDPVWVMNVVPVEAKVNTLGVIYERGLIGTYQNWCEAMSTYPRTYDFIHADYIFSLYKDRCDMADILVEMDRILRPGGSVIIRDDVDLVSNIMSTVEGLQWESKMVDSEEGPLVREKILCATKLYRSSAEEQNHEEESTTAF